MLLRRGPQVPPWGCSAFGSAEARPRQVHHRYVLLSHALFKLDLFLPIRTGKGEVTKDEDTDRLAPALGVNQPSAAAATGGGRAEAILRNCHGPVETQGWDQSSPAGRDPQWGGGDSGL